MYQCYHMNFYLFIISLLDDDDAPCPAAIFSSFCYSV